ncbi:hypothetical protein EGT74_13135 [Chitinophaga lutea]|uniref:Uncharacterized protein n=2 Tax=Chitinophaga lutea TaxID=2488634 RepID=A0A3N4PH30_9BACT|nr:hypothetical protein EGT74_13135 [Chitinophaga lutea]
MLAFSGCGGKDDPALPTSRNFKLTVSATGLSATDYDGATIAVAGSLLSSTESTLWKVNGQVRNNEKGISFTKAELLAGGTFVLESIRPLAVIDVTVSCTNFNEPFNLKIKTEVDGQVKENIDQAVTNSFEKHWQY